MLSRKDWNHFKLGLVFLAVTLLIIAIFRIFGTGNPFGFFSW